MSERLGTGVQSGHAEPVERRAPTSILVQVTVVALCLSLLGIDSCQRDTAQSGSRPPGPLYTDLRGLVAATPVIAVGTVTKIERGRVAVVGEDRLEFNDIFMRQERVLKGTLADPFVLEQVAHVEKIVTPGIGPAYHAGERYLLFLQPGEGHRYIPVVQGRFRIDNGRIVPLDEGPAANRLKDKSEEEVLMNIAQVTR